MRDDGGDPISGDVTIRAIRMIGDPVLRERAREVDDVHLPVVQQLIDDLIETKRAANGAGIAANQVGDLHRVAVVEVEPGNPRYPYKPPYPLTVMVNPELEPIGDDTIEINEGCLSVPDQRGDVRRHARVRVRFLDRDGNRQEIEVAGLTAGTFQHEIDHLDGVLFVDHADSVSSWDEADFEERARAIVEAYGS